MDIIGNPSDTAVSFENVTVELGNVSILESVSASVPRGGCTAIIGPNGAGKTTLLLALLGEVPYKGRIHTACRVSGGCSRIGYVPQRLAFDRGIPITVTEFLVMGTQKKPLWFGVRRDLKNKAIERLAEVKSEYLAERKLGALSGGEFQRVLLALALLQEPELLVLDEPAAGVDFQGEHVFCELLDGLRKKMGFTQLMVSHDLATVTHHATHVICLNRKVAAEGPPREALTSATLTAIFGMHMGLVDSRSMPDGAAVCTAECCTKDTHD
ncbi:MAG: metal ABC transporter ATP-binding protein [Desulfosalsimonadaceae bacterium]|nr:metal ABC transporter ATP-binding protein [Desulfosalsimonadaceae bacterium]